MPFGVDKRLPGGLQFHQGTALKFYILKEETSWTLEAVPAHRQAEVGCGIRMAFPRHNILSLLKAKGSERGTVYNQIAGLWPACRLPTLDGT